MRTSLAVARGQPQLPTLGGGDYRYLEDVVRIGYPVRDAMTYLNRHLGNPVGYQIGRAHV